MRDVGLLVLVLHLCLAGSGCAGLQRHTVLDDLLRASHYVRALITESQQNDLVGESERQETAVADLATAGAKVPRWALLHALAEEHERLSWREGSAGSWHGERAACLYSHALASRALRRLPAQEFSALFNRTALTIERLSRISQRSSTGPPSVSNDPGAQARLTASRVFQEQDEQCAATMVEYERWRDKRDEVINFGLASAFHPLRWLSSEGLATKKTVHVRELRHAFESRSLDNVMRPVVKHLWRNFSPEQGDGVSKSFAANSGTDLREVLKAVGKWRQSTHRQLPVDGVDAAWWDKFLRACAVDGPTSRCPTGSEQMMEADLDRRKSDANQLHLELNAERFPLVQIEGNWYRAAFGVGSAGQGMGAARGAKILPIWLRVCQRTDPLAVVLRHLRFVHGIQDAVLLVSVDRDLMEPILDLLAHQVDYMHVRVFFHPYTHSRSSLGFHGWDTGVHRLNAHYIFGLRLALIALDFRYVITLEDDLLPSRDFLHYHRDLWAIAQDDASVAAILAYPNGPRHDCNFIASKLRPLADPPANVADGDRSQDRNSGGSLCAFNASNVLYTDDFFAGWGAGIPRRTFYRFLPVWNFSGIYDGILNGLLADGLHTLAPCQPRVRIALNTGLHGVSHERWDHWLYRNSSSAPLPSTSQSSTSVSPSNSVYHVIDPSSVASNDTLEDMEEGLSGLGALVTQAMAARMALDRPLYPLQRSRAGPSDLIEHGASMAAWLSASRARRLVDGSWPEVSLRRGVPPLPYRVWSSDFHVGPIGDLKVVWKDILVHGRPLEILDRSLSGSCKTAGTCATAQSLRVLNQSNGQDLGADPEALIAAFLREYRDDEEMRSVDAFVCSHPAAMCEVFEGLNKSLLVYATTRYEMARCFSDAARQGCALDTSRWRKWSGKVRKWHLDRRHVISANNAYDAAYIRYFTGVAADTIPNFSDMGQSYGPRRAQILLSMAQHVEHALMPLLEGAVEARGLRGRLTFAHIRRLYPRYAYRDLTQHPAIVFVPYQVSVMSFFEQYRLNIPLLVPSRRLLTSWAVSSGVLEQRTWASVFGMCSVSSAIEAHPDSFNLSDPNNDHDERAVFEWLEHADFYTFPHVLYWDSPEDLVELAAGRSIDLALVSHRMRMYNLDQGRVIRRQWKSVLERALPRHSL